MRKRGRLKKEVQLCLVLIGALCGLILGQSPFLDRVIQKSGNVLDIGFVPSGVRYPSSHIVKISIRGLFECGFPDKQEIEEAEDIWSKRLNNVRTFECRNFKWESGGFHICFTQ